MAAGPVVRLLAGSKLLYKAEAREPAGHCEPVYLDERQRSAGSCIGIVFASDDLVAGQKDITSFPSVALQRALKELGNLSSLVAPLVGVCPSGAHLEPRGEVRNRFLVQPSAGRLLALCGHVDPIHIKDVVYVDGANLSNPVTVIYSAVASSVIPVHLERAHYF